MKTIFIIFAIGVSSFSNSIFCQDLSIDSLKRELSHATTDKQKGSIFYGLANSYNFINADTAVYFAFEALHLAEKENDSPAIARTMIPLSSALVVQGNYPLAVHYSIEAISFFERRGDSVNLALAASMINFIYKEMGEYEKALKNMRATTDRFNRILHTEDNYSAYAFIFDKSGVPDSVIYYARKAIGMGWLRTGLSVALANAFNRKGMADSALLYYRWSIEYAKKINFSKDLIDSYNGIAEVYMKSGRHDSVKYYLAKTVNETNISAYPMGKLKAYDVYVKLYDAERNSDSALLYLKNYNTIRDQLFNRERQNAINNIFFARDLQEKELEKAKKDYENKTKQNLLISGVIFLLLASGLLVWTIRQKQKSLVLVSREKEKVETQKTVAENALDKLMHMQKQLIQSEKLASLGELTAGIAHEIQNPLNFVNNFSEVNIELIGEIKKEINEGNYPEVNNLATDLEANMEKIAVHGKRADAIVKSMIQHSKAGSAEKESKDINELAEEYLKLSYHGIRAKDKSFNVALQTIFDEHIGSINIISQDIGRVLLNIYNNAFYAVAEKKREQPEGYEPRVTVKTNKVNDRVEIRVADNGNGISEKVLNKIFQPFFTTKPTGEGTGLGLSLSYDIVKAHGGEIKVETKEGSGTEFIIRLPMDTSK